MKGASRTAGAALLAALLAGCATAPAPRSVDLGVPVPGRWTGGETPAGRPGPLWWAGFEDPELDRVLEEALASNHDLRAAAARIDAAAAQARIAGADRLPGVDLSLTGSRSKQIFIGFPLPGGGTPSSTATSLGLSLGTSWEADLWGRLRAGEAAALADLQAAEADFAAARLSLLGQTAKVWFALAEVGTQEELAERTVASYRTTVKQVRDRFERGLRPALDLRLALSNLHAAEALLQQRRLERDGVVRQLETLLGRYPAGLLRGGSYLPAVPGPVPAGIPADLVRRRPDLVAAERRLAGADSRVAAARRALYPSFSLSVSGGTTSNELRDLLDGDFSVWGIVASLFQPIFQGGRLRAGVRLSDAQAREAAETYLGSALRAYAEVETAIASEALLEDLEASLGAASRQSAAARALAEDRYGAGLDDFLTVLEAQRRDLDAEGRLIEVRRQRLDARVDLHLALGGGFDVRPLDEPEGSR